MTRKQRRMAKYGGGLAILLIAGGLVAWAMRDSLVYFYSPSEALAKELKPGQRIRIGGLVAEGSLETLSGTTVRFQVTDLAETLPAEYTGVLPDLFREGQGVVAEGVLREDGVFEAAEVLAKHDENYMPAEVADALKASGQWKHGGE